MINREHRSAESAIKSVRELPWSEEKYADYKAKCAETIKVLNEFVQSGWIEQSDYKLMVAIGSQPNKIGTKSQL